MSVLMPNTTLAVRRREPAGVDAHGEPTPGVAEAGIVGPFPGRIRELADGTWTLGVDPACWPVRRGDLVVEPGGRTWVAQTAALLENNLDSTVNWVRVTAVEAGADGTEPGGVDFAGRPAG